MTFKGAILAIYNGESLEESLKDRVSAKEIEDMGIDMVLNPSLTSFYSGELLTSTSAQALLRPTKSGYMGLGPGHQAF